MTAKEKAEDLIYKFKPYSHFWVNDFGTQKEYDLERLENAKECALIAVDEMIEQVKKFKFMIHHEYEIMYLNTVKQEIEKL